MGKGHLCSPRSTYLYNILHIHDCIALWHHIIQYISYTRVQAISVIFLFCWLKFWTRKQSIMLEEPISRTHTVKPHRNMAYHGRLLLILRSEADSFAYVELSLSSLKTPIPHVSWQPLIGLIFLCPIILLLIMEPIWRLRAAILNTLPFK